MVFLYLVARFVLHHIAIINMQWWSLNPTIVSNMRRLVWWRHQAKRYKLLLVYCVRWEMRAFMRQCQLVSPRLPRVLRVDRYSTERQRHRLIGVRNCRFQRSCAHHIRSAVQQSVLVTTLWNVCSYTLEIVFRLWNKKKRSIRSVNK